MENNSNVLIFKDSSVRNRKSNNSPIDGADFMKKKFESSTASADCIPPETVEAI